MPRFAESQREFARALRSHDAAWSGARTTRYPLDEAMGIYRNNWRHNLTQALAGAYPVLGQVVGAEFFHQFAMRFMDEHPSQSGNLHDYGNTLPAFLERFAPAQSLPYLPDLAALEWACHRAYFAEDESPLDLQEPALIPEEDLERIRFTLHPAVALLHSPWPVGAIWRAHQPGAPEDFRIDLDEGPCRVLVRRQQGEIVVEELAADEYAWLDKLQAGATLGHATERTLSLHPTFNPGTLLLRIAALGLLTRFALENPK